MKNKLIYLLFIPLFLSLTNCNYNLYKQDTIEIQDKFKPLFNLIEDSDTVEIFKYNSQNTAIIYYQKDSLNKIKR